MTPDESKAAGAGVTAASSVIASENISLIIALTDHNMIVL